jgi:hypothetical protein
MTISNAKLETAIADIWHSDNLPRVTSKTLGVGPCERNWAAVKNVKMGKRHSLGRDSVETRCILYSTALINESILNREANEKIDAEGPTAMFCNDDFK